MTTTKPSVVIVADGGIDLPEGFAERFGIKLVPLMVHFGNEQYHARTEITEDEFYARLRAGGSVHPSTSQPSAGEYVEIYKEAAEAGLPILSFHVSGGLSGSIRSAQAAAQMLPELDIRIVDTGTLSSAMAMQVLVAADMAARGASPDEIIAEAVRINAQADMYYTIDTLEYLRRGGRIGRVAGFVGSLMGIRPIITVDKATGTYVGAGRGRSFRRAAQEIVEKVVAQVGEGQDVTFMVMHGDCVGEAENMAAMLRERLNVRFSEIIRVNPALGVHVGPDVIGVCFYPGVLPVAALEPELV